MLGRTMREQSRFSPEWGAGPSFEHVLFPSFAVVSEALILWFQHAGKSSSKPHTGEGRSIGDFPILQMPIMTPMKFFLLKQPSFGLVLVFGACSRVTGCGKGQHVCENS